MASNGKKKTTMAKLNRESKLRERRAIKAAKKQARKDAPPDTGVEHDPLFDEQPADQTAGEPLAADPSLA